MEILVLGISVLLPAVAIGWAIGRFASVKAAMITAGALLVLAAIMVLLGRQQQGLDGLGYIIPAVVLVAPGALGIGLGGGIARLLRR